MRDFKTNLSLMTRRAAPLGALLVSVAFLLHGSTKGPDAAGYTATDAVVYSFLDISGSGGSASTLAGTDDGLAAITMPFAFQFYGQSYTVVCASTNGALYFVSTPGACAGFNDFNNTDLTVSGPPVDYAAILPLWSDLTFQVGGSGALFYQTLGSPGSRRFVVQWENAYPLGSLTQVTFQAILSEGTNQILFQYQTVGLGIGDPANNGGGATIGIRNSGGVASGQQIQWSYKAPVIANGTAILFGLGLGAPQTIAFGALSDKTLGAAPFTVSATASSGLPVTFTSATPSVCTVSGVTVTLISAGTCSITASQAGNASYAAATVTQSFRVAQASTPPTASVTLGSSQNPSSIGQPVTFTATIAYIGQVVPTGTVQFFDGTRLLGTVTLVNGQASLTVTLSLGAHMIVANYSGDGTYPPASDSYGESVGRLSSGTMSLTSSLSTATFGQAVTFTVQLPQPPSGVAPPSGQVQFFDGTTLIGTAPISSSGIATLTVANLVAGLHQITATYAGDNNWNSATTATLTQIVAKALTAIALTPSVSASNPASVTMTATVVVTLPGGGTPTGVVQFVDATTNTVLATATLAGGIATAQIPLSLLNLTNDLLIARYVGDGNFVGIGSAPLAQVVAVNAASYVVGFAPDEIVTIFGTGLANAILWGQAGSQANSLAGLTLGIADSAGVSRQTHLFYVSPTQISFLVPSNVALGPTMVTVAGSNGAAFYTFFTTARVAPGLFTANSNGKGIAAAQIVRVHADGSQDPPQNIATYDPIQQTFVGVPIDMGPSTDTLFLVLYGTGIRHGVNVTCTIGGQAVQVVYAGLQPVYTGLDQINVQLPASLKGAGQVNISIAVDGQISNTASMLVK